MSQVRRSGSERAEYWRKSISAWSRSGETQAAFCRKQRIKYCNFVWWKRKLALDSEDVTQPRGSRGKRARPTKTGSFVEVQLAGRVNVPAYEVVLARGRVLRIFGAFDSDSVSRLITAVEAAC